MVSDLLVAHARRHRHPQRRRGRLDLRCASAGAETDQTAVLIDGVKLNDPSSTGGGYNFATLLAGDVDRIEVLRGPQSTLWGSQAIGGVVSMIQDPGRALSGDAVIEGELARRGGLWPGGRRRRRQGRARRAGGSAAGSLHHRRRLHLRRGHGRQGEGRLPQHRPVRRRAW